LLTTLAVPQFTLKGPEALFPIATLPSAQLERERHVAHEIAKDKAVRKSGLIPAEVSEEDMGHLLGVLNTNSLTLARCACLL